jgi:hypothetical protein
MTILLEDNYENWLKWVVHEKQQNAHKLKNNQGTKIPALFQLDVTKNDNLVIDVGSDTSSGGKWDQIRKLIKVDPNLDQK